MIIAETANFSNAVEINKPVTIIAKQSINTQIKSEVEVTLKGDGEDEGIVIKGIDEGTATINPSQVSHIMSQLKDDMFAEKVYPGDQTGEDGKKTFTLASWIANCVKELVGEMDYDRLEVGADKNIPYGYYEVALTIGGATVSKMIRVDTLTVDTLKTFNDVLQYNIKTIKINKDLNIEESIIIPERAYKYGVLVIDGGSNVITLSENDKFTNGGIVILTDDIEIKDLKVNVNSNNTFGIQFYGVDGGKLNNVTVSNSKKGGVLINGSEVIISSVTTENNTWGGIEVSQGQGVEKQPKLIVQEVGTHNDAKGTPAIWIDGKTSNDGWVEAKGYKTIEIPEGKSNQVWFAVDSAE